MLVLAVPCLRQFEQAPATHAAINTSFAPTQSDTPNILPDKVNAKQTYRLLPIKLDKQELSRFHGRDEPIAKSAYRDKIRFYYQCLLNSVAP